MIKGIQVERDHDIDQFTFYWSFKDAIRDLQDGDKLQIYEAITDFAFFGREPGEMSAFSKLCWKLIKPHLQRSRNNGGRGGAPVGNKNATRNNRKSTDVQPKKNNPLEEEIEIEKNKKGVVGGTQHPQAPNLSQEEVKFSEWMKSNYPHVVKMEQPLTMGQYKQLESSYGKDAVLATLNEMESWKPLTKKNRSAYRTAQKWITNKK